MIPKGQIEKLKSISIIRKKEREGKKSEVKLNAYKVFDEEFLKWVEEQLGGLSSKNRLLYRLTIVDILEKLKELDAESEIQPVLCEKPS